MRFFTQNMPRRIPHVRINRTVHRYVCRYVLILSFVLTGPLIISQYISNMTECSAFKGLYIISERRFPGFCSYVSSRTWVKAVQYESTFLTVMIAGRLLWTRSQTMLHES